MLLQMEKGVGGGQKKKTLGLLVVVIKRLNRNKGPKSSW